MIGENSPDRRFATSELGVLRLCCPRCARATSLRMTVDEDIKMLKIERKDYEALRHHGEETYPHECCGVLLGEMNGDARRVTSIARCGNTRTDSPQNRYNIDPRELVWLLVCDHQRGKRESSGDERVRIERQ